MFLSTRLFVVFAVSVCHGALVSHPLNEGTPKAPLAVQIVHYNDFHARFEETSKTSGTCLADPDTGEKDCIGGFARLFTAVTNTLNDAVNPILLNAGDNFQGTLWYTIHKWNVTAEFMVKLPHAAMGLGNHEFDDKIDGVVPYLRVLKEHDCPILAANLDSSEEPRFEGLIDDFVVVEREGRKIGIVGYMLSTTNEISSTEKLKFTDEIAAVNRVTKKLKEEQAIDIFIGLSHSGIDVDIKVAEQCPDIDVIVGGHSHTLLYTGTPPSPDTAYDAYPVVVTQQSGRKVLVVQASAYTKYLGNLRVLFDEAGEVDSWDGVPIYLDKSIAEDSLIVEQLTPWKEAVDEMSKEVIGSTLVFLDATEGACGKGECNIGSFITDAMTWEYYNKSTTPGAWTAAAIAATNSGGIRTSIDEVAISGIITFGDLALVQPFQNTFDVVELQGKHILEALEFSVSRSYTRGAMESRVFSGQGFLQWSGLRVKFDMNFPVNSRVARSEVTVLCHECRVPQYLPLDLEKWYPIVMNSFLVDGGDGYVVIRDNHRKLIKGREDIEILRDYLAVRSPIVQGLDSRTVIIQAESSAVSLTSSLVIVFAAFVAWALQA